MQETPSGGLRIPARVTRVGVLQYSDAEGNTWGELRPSEEVFAEDSLATLRMAPVTDLHPGALVTPETWRTLAKGHVADDVRRDGEYVAASVCVLDADEIELVRSRQRVEVSCGYECDVDETPGVHEGIAYRAIQRNIRYNHLGLGPQGWGRAGSSVALRMDGAAVSVQGIDTPMNAPHARIDSKTAASADTTRNGARMKTIKIRGKTFRLDADEEMAEAQKTADAMGDEVAKGADLGAQLDAATAALTEALKTVAQLKAEMAIKSAATPAPVTEENVPEEVQDSLVSKRLALLTSARKVLPATVKLDGMKAIDIKRAVIAHVAPAVKMDSFDAKTIDGIFTAVTSLKSDATKTAKRADASRETATKVETVLAVTEDQADAVSAERVDGMDDPIVMQQRALHEMGRVPLSSPGQLNGSNSSNSNTMNGRA